MTDRISIRALREVLAQPSAREAYAHPDDVLALVEAVEALEKIRRNAEAWHGPLQGTGHERSLAVIAKQSADALARFDFGEEA